MERRYPDRYGSRDPDVITRKELEVALSRFVELVLENVGDPQVRDRIEQSFQQLTHEIDERHNPEID